MIPNNKRYLYRENWNYNNDNIYMVTNSKFVLFFKCLYKGVENEQKTTFHWNLIIVNIFIQVSFLIRANMICSAT